MTAMRTALFEELVPSPDMLMGVKAVFGVLVSRVMCFGSRGDRSASPGKHYQAAKSTAEKAMSQRWLISIGGGKDVPEELRGRVLNITSVSGTYGEMAAFIDDRDERARLAQWPTAVALRDVYDIEGYPRVVDDLGFPDMRLLTNAFDQVVRPEPAVDELWQALRRRTVTLRDLPPIVAFNDEDKLVLVGERLPTKVTGAEGDRRYREAQMRERDRALAAAVKEHNRSKNKGILVCEGCTFTDSDASLFDAHHLSPLALGSRLSVVSDFAVLCPTCHRVVHHAGRKVLPLPIADLRGWWTQRRP